MQPGWEPAGSGAPRRAAAACVLCCAPAAVFCRNDEAFLCGDCDLDVHKSSSLAATHERLPATAVAAPAAAASDSAATASPLPTPTAQQIRHTPSLTTLTGGASLEPSEAAPLGGGTARAALAAGAAFAQHVSLRMAGAAAARPSPFSFHCQHPLAPPPPLPAGAGAAWARGAASEDFTRWDGPAGGPPAQASSLDAELMVRLCAAGPCMHAMHGCRRL